VDSCNLVCTYVSKRKPVDGDGCCNPEIHANANIDSDCRPMCGNGVVERGEECDDGNKSASDTCGNDCKVVNQFDRCIDAVGLRDACTTCICQNCLDVTSQCYATPSDEQNTLCLNLARCQRKSKCTGADCYCAQDLLGCEADPKGLCKNEVEAAAGTASLSQIALRSQDPQYVIGRVNAVGQCAWNRCQSECAQ
jgi:cysteine-rich repeat protein